MKTVDLIVVGGGPGGYSATIRAAQSGLDTLCVEKEHVGGVCLNWGCVPSKSLITVAQRYQSAMTGARLGVQVDRVRLDMHQAQEHSRSVVQHHTQGVATLIRAAGAELVYGSARLTSPSEIEIVAREGKTRRVRARRGIVLATGASPREVPGFAVDRKRILSAREAVFLEQVPEHLIVLGGGVVGLELGSAFHHLGARLTVIELGPALLPGIDPDLVAVVRRRLEGSSARFELETTALRHDYTQNGVRVQFRGAQGEHVIEGTHVLVAAGFVPRVAGLGLEAAGVQLDARGHIATRENCETNVPGIYAIGDIAGPPYLAHKAFAEAQVVVDVISGRNVKRDWRAMPAVVFTEPEIATVGLSQTQAGARGLNVELGRFPFSASSRASARAKTDGYVKLIAQSDRLVGAGIVGSEASELIAELTLAIEVGATLEDIALTVHPHPTLSEAVHDAAEHGRGSAVHVANRRPSKGRALSEAV